MRLDYITSKDFVGLKFSTRTKEVTHSTSIY